VSNIIVLVGWPTLTLMLRVSRRPNRAALLIQQQSHRTIAIFVDPKLRARQFTRVPGGVRFDDSRSFLETDDA
jgi:hypothetical protein